MSKPHFHSWSKNSKHKSTDFWKKKKKEKRKKVSFEMEKDPEKVVKEVPKVYPPTLGLWFESGLCPRLGLTSDRTH